MSENNRLFWKLSKHEQKRALEAEIGLFLTTHGAELTNSNKYFLREALVHIFAGRYELACESMDDVYDSPVEIAEVRKVGKSVTHRALVRAFREIKATPPREYRTFR
jgi:hypothetical protein